MNSSLKSAYKLTMMIVLLTLVATTGGLFLRDLYKDSSSFALNAWYANDLIVLGIGLPLMCAALVLSLRGSLRGQLVWLGMINFTIYNYSYYLFGAALNSFFIIYTTIFSLSMFTLVFGLIYLDYNKIEKSFAKKTPVKGISIFMILLALTLGGAWISQWINFVITGESPQIMVNLDATNNLVASLDLTFVVPLCCVAAYYLWKRKPIGYVLTIMLNVKGFVYNLILILGSIVQAKAGVKGAMDLVPLWVIFCIGCLCSFVVLLFNMKPVKDKRKKLKKIG
ncbi:hypothetical protein [Neobacillus drentensis]|uniref:hypothetical protein n=1 Tax=Neobacillus drentensis TaxID=220684 RepID=UPI002FFEDD1B